MRIREENAFTSSVLFDPPKRQDKGDHPHYTDENSEAQGDGKLLKTVLTLYPRDKNIPGFFN